MTKNKIALIVTIIIIAALIIQTIFSVIDTRKKTGKQKEIQADGFTIDAYNVKLDVLENNIVKVNENIIVDWYNTRHHGIYKFTPEWYEYTGKDGKTIKRKSIITDLKAIGDKYTTDWVKKKARIKIGSANRYVNYGPRTYSISYNYNMGKDPFKGFDEFIFHAYGDYWGTEIKNATLQVKMPKSIEGYNINFYIDKYREENITEYVNYIINDNTLYAEFKNEEYYNQTGKKLTESLTLDIELPEGYFIGESDNYGMTSFIISIIIIVLTIIVTLIWIKYGKDLPKKEQTVEFYPPDNLSSAEIGYIYKKQTSKRLTISLIISLAAKGYIKIDELEDKKIKITNNVGIRPSAPIIQDIPSRQIEVIKKKDIDENLSKKAKNMMRLLFREGDHKVIKANINKFLEANEELSSGGYIEVIGDNENEIKDKTKTIQEEYEIESGKYNEIIRRYNERMLKLPPVNSQENIVFNRLFEESDEIILSEHKTFYRVFKEIDNYLDIDFKNKINDTKAISKRGWAICSIVITAILSIFSYSIIEDMNPKLSAFYGISFICVFINILLAIIMKRKTEYGEYISARVKGFRDFLETVEKPKLEELVESEPSYFYNILPYTYALNISKKWVEKFENIQIPINDMGNFNYVSDSSWNYFCSDIYTPAPVSTSGGSGGCSSCGGGCSSCGGGCSSCGGGGSW